MSYGRVQYLRGSLEIGAFVNRTSAGFNSVLSRDPSGQLLDGQMNSSTYDIGLKDTRFLGGRHFLSYGASARYITLDFTLAPEGEGRSEQGFSAAADHRRVALPVLIRAQEDQEADHRFPAPVPPKTPLTWPGSTKPTEGQLRTTARARPAGRR